jgi:hypothetical protein
MPDPGGSGELYEVHCSGVIALALKDAQRRATLEGRGPQALSAIRTIRRYLATDPVRFGERLYHLPALRMQVRCAIVLPLAVHFAVCDDRPLVFINGIKLLGSPGEG